MTKNLKGEILSPVGSKEMLYAAVRSGADAVYLGAKDFSARRNAENFGTDELIDVVEFCHIRGVSVYLTLNILIKDSEMQSALDLALKAYNAGIDGIIVEDLGLARLLHQSLPDLPLHASTQMSIHTPAAIPLLSELGFKQVVAAREMSLSELREFCKTAALYGMVVEVFVHGALCMCVSGQCLLSAYLGSRSGNRGLCAGPCRLPFNAENGTGYDLSLKDLSLIDSIGTLYDIGVRSFKIEGRMKRPEYVAAATKACKDALHYKTVDTALKNTLKDVFSRSGFTDGYLTAKLGRDMFGIRTKEDVTAADKAFPLLHELYRKEYKSVPLDITAKIKRDTKISLTLCDGENTVTVKGDVPQRAQNKALSFDDARKNLTKFGDTPFFENNFQLELDDGLFLPASLLNALRREACEKISALRGAVIRQNRAINYTQKKNKSSAKIPDLVIRIENADQMPQSFDGIKAVIIPLESDIVPTSDIEFIVDIPRGIVSESLIRDRLLKFKEMGVKRCLCGNLSALPLAKNVGFTVIADTGLNVYNSEATLTCENLGVGAIVASNEMKLSEIKALCHTVPLGIISYGKIPLMLFRNCPIKNGKSCNECDKKSVLTDRMGAEFPVRCRMGYSELLNSVPVWLADRQNELLEIDFQILYFTNETADEVNGVISAYKNGNGCPHKYTRGLFYKGTI